MQGFVAAAVARGAWPSLEPHSVGANSHVAAVAPLEGQTQGPPASLEYAPPQVQVHPMHRGESFYVGQGGMAAVAAAPAVAAAAAASLMFYSTVVKLLEDELVEAR